MSISAKTVKELREKTGAGMMDCKRALSETEGDMEAAVALLREKGLASAAKKAGRVAAEGLVGVFASEDASEAVVVELNSETDFVAKNENFAALLETVGKALLASGVDEGTGETGADIPVGDSTIGATIQDGIASIGENLSLRRFARIRATDGIVGSYIHGAGKIGVLVELRGGTPAQTELARSLAMHVAAANPRFTNRDEVSESVLDGEREIARNQALAAGKPEKIIERIVEGKVQKFYGEVCAVEQAFVKDPDLTITKLLEKEGKDAGATLEFVRFLRFQLGEGIEKKESNLAEEVAEQLAQGS